MLPAYCACARLYNCASEVGASVEMLGLWSAGREYAVQDLVIFALTAVVGLVVILLFFWLCGGDSGKVHPQLVQFLPANALSLSLQSGKIKPGKAKQPARWNEPAADEQ